MESSPTNMSFLPKAADRWSPAAPTKIKNSVGEGFPLPLVGIFILHPGGALPSLPCVRGGAALRAAEGLYPTKTIFFFCSANSPPLQSLRRCRASSLYTREPFKYTLHTAGGASSLYTREPFKYTLHAAGGAGSLCRGVSFWACANIAS